MKYVVYMKENELIFAVLPNIRWKLMKKIMPILYVSNSSVFSRPNFERLWFVYLWLIGFEFENCIASIEIQKRWETVFNEILWCFHGVNNSDFYYF